ncbi:hypothetical protein VNO77_09174 [Canavalia gladiata]|uniref:Uncharacterized protein n=1 Tax=Canavalia gladiata TaxID=3824 RepID=A0AAN9M900_CANGL
MEVMEMNTGQVVLGAVLVLLLHVFNILVLRPRSLRAKLQKQGIDGPSPHFYFGNIAEIKTLLLQVQSAQVKDKDVSVSHTWPFTLFPHIQKWVNQYCQMCQILNSQVKSEEICPSCSFLQENGWNGVSHIHVFFGEYTVANDDRYREGEGNPHVHQFESREAYLSIQRFETTFGPRYIVVEWASLGSSEEDIAPELYVDKGMVNLIIESTNITLRYWETRVESEGGVSEIKIDEDLRSLSADIIGRACFGSNYFEGKEIFLKLRDLQKLLSNIDEGIPGFRYLPNKSNRQMWKLEKEINLKISKLIKQRQEETHEEDLLQMILEGAKNCEGGDGPLSNSISRDRFMIDNCKNIFFAGHETTAIATSWCLMLLATNQDWQDRARDEVLQVCGNGAPDASMLRSMKTFRFSLSPSYCHSPAFHLVIEPGQGVVLKMIRI